VKGKEELAPIEILRARAPCYTLLAKTLTFSWSFSKTVGTELLLGNSPIVEVSIVKPFSIVH
jgi:hypothetical protein